MFAITFCTKFHWSDFVFLFPFTLYELSAILSVLQICFSLCSSYCQLRYGHMSIVFLFLTLYSPIPSDIFNLVCIHNIVLPSSLHVFPTIYLCLIVCRSLTLFLLFRPIFRICQGNLEFYWKSGKFKKSQGNLRKFIFHKRLRWSIGISKNFLLAPSALASFFQCT